VNQSSPASLGATLAEEELVARLRWFIRHRWVAAVAVPMVAVVASAWLHVDLPLAAICATAFSIVAYNLLFCRLVKVVEGRRGAAGLSAAKLLANAQISSDLAALTVLIHFSGGVENPFAFFFIFHIIIASILLSPRATFAQAGLATFLFCSTCVLEEGGIIRHYSLWPFLPAGHHQRLAFLSGNLLVVTATLFISAYFATSITRRLRQREEQVVRLSEDLRLAYDRLSASEHAKALYMRKVSHELRAPLAAIRSTLTVILEGFLGPLAPKHAEMLGRADRRAGELLSLIEDILVLTRSREAPLERDKVRLSPAEVLDSVIALLRPRADAKGLTLETHLPAESLPLLGEPESIRELFTNLIANAIKYTPKGGKASVSASADSNFLRVSVSDTGIGINAEDLANIFDEFYRAENARQFDAAGTGLGLSIVKAIVQAHGGQITVASEPGQGTTFEVLLPLAASAGGAD